MILKTSGLRIKPLVFSYNICCHQLFNHVGLVMLPFPIDFLPRFLKDL
jgi:hypothetical protein